MYFVDITSAFVDSKSDVSRRKAPHAEKQKNDYSRLARSGLSAHPHLVCAHSKPPFARVHVGRCNRWPNYFCDTHQSEQMENRGTGCARVPQIHACSVKTPQAQERERRNRKRCHIVGQDRKKESTSPDRPFNHVKKRTQGRHTQTHTNTQAHADVHSNTNTHRHTNIQTHAETHTHGHRDIHRQKNRQQTRGHI